MTSEPVVPSHDMAFGLLVGGALGDALGAPFEGRETVEQSDLDAHEGGGHPPDSYR
ncbi:hypothetical protein SAMN05660733_00744 [Lentzea albidocapillata]|uniref:ADP-ribosylglycohydrolase n=1 Tax=Lentzea albidocapillata TaxID=40571 RepID=A0A1W2AM53_9PSEU|nr:hypothetical protein SAMN05660733_00744 [Lentzea albidocapillata]